MPVLPTNRSALFVLPPVYGDIFNYLMILLIGALIITAIVVLVKGISCVINPPNAFEPFESTSAPQDNFYAAVKDRIGKIQKTKAIIESLLTDIGDAADETCSIMKIVQEKYVQSAAAPADDAEATLPENVRIARRNERMIRAEKRFQDEKRAFSVIGNKPPVLECFAVSDGDVDAAESELANEVESLIQLLDNAEVKLSITKSQQIVSSLGFNAKYINKGLEALSPNEGFANMLRGPALLAKADELIGKAAKINDDLAAAKKEITIQQKAIRTMNAKEKDISQGKIIASDVKF